MKKHAVKISRISSVCQEIERSEFRVERMKEKVTEKNAEVEKMPWKQLLNLHSPSPTVLLFWFLF